jgi:uncharacterized membrane protein YedE/YeeE
VNARRPIAALVAGTLFGFGLALGGMLDPSVIRGFLDFFGNFDPRLGFVFAGAVAVSAAGHAFSRRLRRPTFGEGFAIPAERRIDAPLIAGSALFGIGWGMVGLCPGPAISGLTLGIPQISIFTASMIAGMAAYQLWVGRGVGGRVVDVGG